MKWLDKIVLRIFSNELTLLQDEDKYLLKEIQDLRKRVTELETKHCYTESELDAQVKINTLFTEALVDVRKHLQTNKDTIEGIHHWNKILVDGLKDRNLL